jgi:hypothetical protein
VAFILRKAILDWRRARTDSSKNRSLVLFVSGNFDLMYRLRLLPIFYRYFPGYSSALSLH